MNNKKIFKYVLRFADVQAVLMPIDATILSIQAQGDAPTLWALVDPFAATEFRNIAMYGTGKPLPDHIGEYIGTFQSMDGAVVFHAFEVKQ